MTGQRIVVALVNPTPNSPDMKSHVLSLLLAAPLGALLLVSSAAAANVSFGGGGNQFEIDFVEIGSPGNAADTTGSPNPSGAVGYNYQLAKYEISRDMVLKANAASGLGITLADLSSFGGNGVNRPATGVSWNEAARFVNWLNTSQGFSPAYKFLYPPGHANYNSATNIQLWTTFDAGYDPANPFRNSNAKYFLPSADEWYKAAYYDPNANGGLGGYWDYANGSNTAPTKVISGTAAGTAVYNQSFNQGPTDITTAGGLSPWGVMALNGNVSEWVESEFDRLNDSVSADRELRGGDYFNIAVVLAATNRNGGQTTGTNEGLGFRVASVSAVPEPSSYAWIATAMFLGAWTWRRRLGN
jgi:hypothetical protein